MRGNRLLSTTTHVHAIRYSEHIVTSSRTVIFLLAQQATAKTSHKHLLKIVFLIHDGVGWCCCSSFSHFDKCQIHPYAQKATVLYFPRSCCSQSIKFTKATLEENESMAGCIDPCALYPKPLLWLGVFQLEIQFQPLK